VTGLATFSPLLFWPRLMISRLIISALAALVAIPLLAGCSVVETPRQPRGHKVEEDVLKELTPGTSTRADVIALIGSPSMKASFDDNVWLYISGNTRTRIGRLPALESQDVIELTFTESGTLKDIRRRNLDDSAAVDVVERTTPSPGSESTLMQQFFGSVGRMSPGVPGSRGGAGGSGSSR
jgi:outer membrane protein assembly factor BamE (lipoprotein component of BamABCDE complex)